MIFSKTNLLFRTLFSVLLLYFIQGVYAQQLNGYKYAYVPTLKYEDGTIDKWEISNHTIEFLSEEGFEILTDTGIGASQISNPCEILIFAINHTNVVYGTNTVTYTYGDCNGQLGSFDGSAMAMSLKADYRNATRKALREFKKNILGSYSYNSNSTPNYKSDVEVFKRKNIDFTDEVSIRNHFNTNGYEGIEGIWNTASMDGSEYKLAILKEDYLFKAYVIEGTGFWKPSELKAEFEPAAVNSILSVKWTMGDKKNTVKTVATIENEVMMTFNLPTANNSTDEIILYKVYPPLNESTSLSMNTTPNEWSGNGSGLIISKSGYIITNYHVIKDAKEIQIEYIDKGQLKSFEASVIQSDKTNDLSLLRIFDLTFNGLSEEPKFNFSTEMAEVGSKVYAYGYPMALTIMGKEIKISDGIVSSKTGFEGDITTYQITAPIQAGSSGGPLFDDKGNLIGINSSGLNKNIADNVAYSIKSAYIKNLIDVLPSRIELPNYTNNEGREITEQIKNISPFVVLVKIKNQ